MADFVTGFRVTAHILLLFSGGCAAVILLALAVLLVLCIAAVLFDWVTTSLGRRWKRKRHSPRNRLERIILDSYQHGDG